MQRLCRLLGVSVQTLYSIRPQDLQHILPQPALCRRVMGLVSTSYNTIVQSGTSHGGCMQEPLSELYNLLNSHSQTQQAGEGSDGGSHRDRSPGGSAEEE